MRVTIWGQEEYGGKVLSREIIVNAGKNGAEITAAQARELAAALHATADELDALSDPESTIRS